MRDLLNSQTSPLTLSDGSLNANARAHFLSPVSFPREENMSKMSKMEMDKLLNNCWASKDYGEAQVSQEKVRSNLREMYKKNPEEAKKIALGGIMMARIWMEDAMIKGSQKSIIDMFKRIMDSAIEEYQNMIAEKTYRFELAQSDESDLEQLKLAKKLGSTF